MPDAPRSGPPTSRPEPRPAAPGAGSPRAQAAAALVGALAKATRAFTLYDPSNALVRDFIAEYQARAEAATQGGNVTLELRPFEIALGGEVVYREEDRERSLAFRLFRDGVRQLVFEGGVRQEDLLALLRVLAVRFAGMRQAEDDVVTLVRKAELRTITLRAVAGYTATEEDGHATAGVTGGEPPADWDTPLPRLPQPGPVACRPVPPQLLSALHAEEAPEAIGQGGVQVARELAAWGARGAISPGEVGRFCAELRDFLVGDGQLGLLTGLAELAERQPAGELRDELLRSLGDERLLDVLLARLPPEGGRLPPEALRLTPFVPAGAMLDRLAGEAAAGRRAALLELVRARLPADAGAVVERLPALAPALVAELLPVLRERAPERADDATAALLAHPDPGIRREALRAAAASSRRLPAEPMVAQLAAPDEATRIAAARALEHHGEGPVARAVADWLQARRSFSREEAVALGRALAATGPGAALRLFGEWLIPPSGILGALRRREHDELLRWAAVAGLGVIPGAEAQNRLEELARGGDEGLRRHALATLARRRAEERRHG